MLPFQEKTKTNALKNEKNVVNIIKYAITYLRKKIKGDNIYEKNTYFNRL